MKIIERWKRSLYKKLIKYHIVTSKVVVLMDGGICSQMHQYIIGKVFENKGYQVVFDLSFYKNWGSDMDYKFVRNFDLMKAFPYLKLKGASDLLISIYKQKYYNLGNHITSRIDDFSFLQKTPPVYLGGYYHFPPEVWLPLFRATFEMTPAVFDELNKQLCSDIMQHSCSVAVHVRRGDLKVEIPAYGKPASLEYFQSAISYMTEKLNLPFFFFFSDEPEWVHNELVSSLQLVENANCKVVNINGSDKGYMDLFLIAHCKHQITSKGTLGKYGALLNDNSQKIVILCDDEIEYYWKGLFNNPIYI